MMAKQNDGDNAPITVGAVIKWGSLAGTAVITIAGLVWHAAQVKQDAHNEVVQVKTDLHAEIEPLKTQVIVNTKDVVDLKAKDEQKTQQINEMGKKLDTAITILQRIDQRVGKP